MKWKCIQLRNSSSQLTIHSTKGAATISKNAPKNGAEATFKFDLKLTSKFEAPT